MADKTIPELVETTEAAATNVFVIDDGVDTKKIQTQNLAVSLRRFIGKSETKSANYDVQYDDDLIRVSGNTQIRLPDATSNEGQEFTVKKIDVVGTTVTIVFSGGQEADDETSLTLTEQYSLYRFKSNGVGYDIVAWG